MARRNIWEQIRESTEGPTVTVTIPRDHAESLLQILASSLEEEMPDDELDSIDDLDFGDDGGGLDGPPEDDMDLDFMPAGDEDDEMVDEPSPPSPPKKGPGRPPGAKNKKKADSPKKDDDGGDDDDGDDEKKEESAGDYRPQTALGESTFHRLGRQLSRKSARPRR